MTRLLHNLVRSNRAATAVEYGLIAALIVIAMVGALILFANANTQIWNNIATKVSAT